MDFDVAFDFFDPEAIVTSNRWQIRKINYIS